MLSEAVDILLLGDPALRVVASPIELFDELAFRTEREQLYATLLEFRNRNKFGRAISATQIGCRKRLIAMHLNGEGHFIVNPEITWASKEHLTMWDDCMSFPLLLVRLERSRSISIHFQDETGQHHDWDQLDIAMSELFQHEIDHLDGILAIDRAIDRDSIILRDTFAAMPELFRKLADYEISAPTWVKKDAVATEG
jgi:peptide deformylase